MTELELYKQNQDALVEKYEGKILGLRGGVVQGVYESKIDAMNDMKARFSVGTFMVIKCTKGDSEYTRRYRSRVFFSENSLSASV